MKLVVVSHSYIVDLNAERLRMLTQIDPTVHITIVVPKRWRPGGVMQTDVVKTAYRKDGNLTVLPLANFSENNQGLLSFGWGYVQLLRQFRPDVILVEQGAKSLAYAQSIFINQVFRLGAKCLLFTWWNLPYSLKPPLAWLESYNLKHTDGLIAGNQDGIRVLRQRGYHGLATVIPQLGVDEHLFKAESQPALRAKLGLMDEDFVVGYVGRFVMEKGLLTLAKALTDLEQRSGVTRPWKWLLLGKGELRSDLERWAVEQGFQDRLIWVESVPHREVARYINVMDTLLLPSETTYAFKTLTAVGWKEQLGHVLIEAMSCKVPVIGSDSGEIPHVIGDTGLVFPEGNVAALQDCLVELISDRQRCATLGQKGYERAMTHYTNRALAEALRSFCHQVLGYPTPNPPISSVSIAPSP